MKFIRADILITEKIRLEFGKEQAGHLHFDDGFTFIALDDQKIVGFASAYIKKPPYVIEQTFESYIDIIEVKVECRRRGIAKKLLSLVEEESRRREAYQVRSWSSEDKKEAIMMWRKLGFSLHPQEIISPVTKKPVKGYFVMKTL